MPSDDCPYKNSNASSIEIVPQSVPKRMNRKGKVQVIFDRQVCWRLFDHDY
jgi:hypothetical protein